MGDAMSAARRVPPTLTHRERGLVDTLGRARSLLATVEGQYTGEFQRRLRDVVEVARILLAEAGGADADASVEICRPPNAPAIVAGPALLQVLEELDRAHLKFPTWPTDPLHALAVLGEEFGELTKDMLQLTYEPHKTTAAKARGEAIQTAAMALRVVASLDDYVYRPSAQHHQRVAAILTHAEGES